MSTKKIPLRSEVLKENTWATEDIFETDAAWEKAFEDAQAFLPKIASFAGQLGSSASKLYEYFLFDEEVDLALTKLYSYAHLNSDTDTGNATYQSMVGRCRSFFVQCGAASAYATPELIAIDDETLERFYKEEPRLELYRRSLDRVRSKRPHVLSESEEKLLASPTPERR